MIRIINLHKIQLLYHKPVKNTTRANLLLLRPILLELSLQLIFRVKVWHLVRDDDDDNGDGATGDEVDDDGDDDDDGDGATGDGATRYNDDDNGDRRQ